MENRYTKQAREALDAAEVYAKELKHPYIGTEHLLMGLRTSISGVGGSGVGDERPERGRCA